MPDEITEKVLDLIASTKRLPREQVSVNSSFEELGLDSLDAINLIYEVETEFDVSVSNELANSITSVPALVEKLKELLAESSSSPQGAPK
ncbi:MAG TPA: phosphopantetheine-binding protein [Candidatus Angelobacter sp.]|jgi:acyl carrier protein|nr:phosphopantetheine-binding protein [Candidatus Angelobacter sp.]